MTLLSVGQRDSYYNRDGGVERRGPLILVDRFQSIAQRKAEADLALWLQDVSSSLIASFARGPPKDLAAVRAAVTEPWSSGQTERHVNRLKLIKRQIYGSVRLNLLEARLIGAP